MLLGVMSMWRAFYAVYIYSWSQADFVVSCSCVLRNTRHEAGAYAAGRDEHVARVSRGVHLQLEPGRLCGELLLCLDFYPQNTRHEAGACDADVHTCGLSYAVYIFSWSQADFVVRGCCVVGAA
jgi:hypothetical protein